MIMPQVIAGIQRVSPNMKKARFEGNGPVIKQVNGIAQGYDIRGT